MTPRRTDQSAIHTWLVLMKAHRTLTRHATRSIEALEMCLSDFAILEALLHKGPQSVRELGRRIESDQRVDDHRHRSARNASSGGAGRSRHRPPRLGHSPDARGQGTHHQGVCRTPGRDGDERCSGLSKAERATLTDLLKRLGTTAEAQLTQEKE